jgi:hypothetical protein
VVLPHQRRKLVRGAKDKEHATSQNLTSAVAASGVAMRTGRFLSASLLTAALALPFASLASAAIVVNIDKTTQQMSVSVDGAPRYVWPVSTGRAGYDTPNGTFKVNRMDADHLSQEWDNAPMPHTMFFDMHGHAIHGFFDVKHLGLPVSHGCVRLAPANATVLFDLVTAEGMSQTTVVVSGQTPVGTSPEVARRRAPVSQRASQKPSRPASKATAMRSILRPAFSASSRQRLSSFSNALSSTASFFNGWRSTPGTMPATSQLDKLISITAISVLSP